MSNEANRPEMVLKFAIDNEGDLVVTDGDRYVGFPCFGSPPTCLTESLDCYASWPMFVEFDDEEIRELGINNIEDWTVVPRREDS